MENETVFNNANDISESASDKEHLKPDTGYIDLPDVEDIPGQENIVPAPLGELADITISSADEEGIVSGFDETNVTEEEKELLNAAAESMGSEEEINIKNAIPDNIDEDGDLLNEQNDLSGNDLDVPGAEDDDADEENGSEDEENNEYSLGGDNHEK